MCNICVTPEKGPFNPQGVSIHMWKSTALESPASAPLPHCPPQHWMATVGPDADYVNTNPYASAASTEHLRRLALCFEAPFCIYPFFLTV